MGIPACFPGEPAGNQLWGLLGLRKASQVKGLLDLMGHRKSGPAGSKWGTPILPRAPLVHMVHGVFKAGLDQGRIHILALRLEGHLCWEEKLLKCSVEQFCSFLRLSPAFWLFEIKSA